MKKLLIVLAFILAPSTVFAQCTGVFEPGAVCANPAAANAPPRATTTFAAQKMFNVLNYGAKGDSRTVDDAAITSGTATLTSATAAFTTADSARSITVRMGTAGVSSGTYVSGGSATGAAGTNCSITSFNGGGSSATAYVTLTGTDTIAGGTAFDVTAIGSGFTSAPTSATLGNGIGATAATCSGTVTITSVRQYAPVTTTMTFVNSTTVTLGTTATNTVSSATAVMATDDSTAILNALAAANTANGGTVYFPGGHTYLMLSQLRLPNDNVEGPPIRLLGDGPRWDSSLLDIVRPTQIGGSVIDLRYDGTVAKILTTYEGQLEIDSLSFIDNGLSSLPFLYTTITTLYVHGSTFSGNPVKTGFTTDQDAIILGGTTTGNDPDPLLAAFAGYGTVIDRNQFTRIRRGIYLRSNANGVVINNNVWDITCGADSSAAAIEFGGTNYGFGNSFDGNLIEMNHYVYGVNLAQAAKNSFTGMKFFDGSVSGPRTLIGLYHAFGTSFIFGGGNNTIFGGWMEQFMITSYPTSNIVYVDDDGRANRVIGSDPYGRSVGTKLDINYDTGTDPLALDSLHIFQNKAGGDGSFSSIQFNSPSVTPLDTGTPAAKLVFVNKDVANKYASIKMYSIGPTHPLNAFEYYDGSITVPSTVYAMIGAFENAGTGFSTAANNTTTDNLFHVTSAGSGLYVRTKGASNGIGGQQFATQIFQDSAMLDLEIYNQSTFGGLVLGTNVLPRLTIANAGGVTFNTYTTAGLLQNDSSGVITTANAFFNGATLQQGAADAASPAAQTTQVQSVVAGTSNTAGVDWTINASRGTGTGVGGNIIVQTAPAGASGSSQNSFIQTTIFDSKGHIRVGNDTAPALTSCGTNPSIIGTDEAGEVTMGTGTPTGCVITFNRAYTSAPLCVLNWQATPLASQSWTVSNTAITTVQTATDSNKLNYICRARNGG